MVVILPPRYAIQIVKLGQNAKIIGTDLRTIGTFVPVVIQLKYALLVHWLVHLCVVRQR